MPTLLITHSDGLPVFQSSSSTELTELLHRLRTKRFLPALLNDQQRKLIRSKGKKSQLENEPVYATVGDEELRLEHLNVSTDIPSAKSFHRVLELSTQSQDWKNIPGVLQGLKVSRGSPPSRGYIDMILKANEAGQMATMIQCLRQVEKNGFSLSEPILRRLILCEIRRNAKDADWSQEATHKSLKQVQQVVELMDHPGHCGRNAASANDPRAEPYVIGIPLELAAVRAKNHLGGVDEGGLVSMYTKRLLAAFEQQETELVTPHAFITSQVPR